MPQSGLVRALPRAAATAPLMSRSPATLWAYPNGRISSTTLGFAANNVFGTLWYVRQPITLTAIASEVTTAASAGNNIRFGVYSLDTEMSLATLVATPGVVLADSTGLKSVTGLSLRLPVGVYFLVVQAQASVTLRAWGSTAPWAQNGTLVNGSAWVVASLPNRTYSSELALSAAPANSTADSPYEAIVVRFTL